MSIRSLELIMVAVGIVGCGAIGSALANALERDYGDVASVVALCDRRRSKACNLQQQLRTHPPIVSLPTLIRRSQLVIEAASVSVASRVARLALAASRDVLIMSAGGLLTSRSSWSALARRSRGRLYVPSGALPGVDALKALSMGVIRRIRLTTRKPLEALASSPLVKSRLLSGARVRRPLTLFEGSVQEAVKAFPQNINVAATIALACEATVRNANRRRGRTPPIEIRIMADPTTRVNVHELAVEADCGRLVCRIESRPSRTNPKTSELAIRSAQATLHQLFEPIRIGT